MARHEETPNAGYHILQTAPQLRRDQHGSVVGPSSAACRPRIVGRPEVSSIAAAGRHVVAEPGRGAVACTGPERLLPTVPAIPRVDLVVEPHALLWSRRVPGVPLSHVQAVSGKEPTVTVHRTGVRGRSAHAMRVDACTGGVVDSTRTVPSRTRAKNHVHAHKRWGGVVEGCPFVQQPTMRTPSAVGWPGAGRSTLPRHAPVAPHAVHTVWTVQ